MLKVISLHKCSLYSYFTENLLEPNGTGGEASTARLQLPKREHVKARLGSALWWYR